MALKILGEGNSFSGAKTIGGALTIGGQVLAAAGDSGAPGVAFSASPDMGIYRRSSTYLGIALGGGERFGIASANSSITARAAGSYGWSPTADPGAGADTVLARAAVGIVSITQGFQFPESSDPTAPAANNVILYAKDNGSGKTLLVARFPTGAVQTVATEP